MLTYLIPSQARRHLLSALYLEAISGSVSTLARHAGIATASARAELLAMEQAGLAQRRAHAGRLLFEAVPKHPHAATLRALLQLPVDTAPAPGAAVIGDKLEADRVRADLAAYGCKLPGFAAIVRTATPLERALARGIVLSHADVDVARAMPALLARHAPHLNFPKLHSELQDLHHKHTAGFLLSVAAQLTNNPTLSTQAEPLRDHRRKRLVDFFSPQAHPTPAKDEMTFELAKEWRFHYPMLLADFVA